MKEPRGALKLLFEGHCGAVTEAGDEFTGCVGDLPTSLGA